MTTEKIGEMYIDIDARTTNIEKDLAALKAKAATEGQKTGSAFSNGFGKALTLLGVTAGIAALFSLVKKSIQAFGEQERVVKKLNATLESTGFAAGLSSTELQKMASGLQAVTTYGDEAIISAQSLLLTFINIGRDVFPDALKAVLDVSTGLEQDLKSSVIQVGKALNDPIKGMAALSRVGIQFSDKQKALIEGFMRTNNVMEAQKVILKELNTQFGGQSSAAAETLTGKITQLSNSWGDFLEQLGGFIASAPGVIWFLEKMSSGFQAWIQVFNGVNLGKLGLQTLEDKLMNARATAKQVTMDELKKSTEESRQKLKAWNEEQISANQKLWQLKQAQIEAGEGNKEQLETEQQLLSITNAQHRGNLDALNAYERKLVLINKGWDSQGATFAEITARISALQESLQDLSPDNDAKKIKEITDEIATLTKKISIDMEAEKNYVTETIKQLKTKNDILALTTGLSRDVMESSKETLEQLLNTVTNEEDRLKILRAIKEIATQIAETKPPEIDFGDMELEDDFEMPDIDIEGIKNAATELRQLRIAAMDNEFAQREAMIEEEFNSYNEHYQKLYEDRLINEQQLQEALYNNQEIKEKELSALATDKFYAGLNAARSINSVLRQAFGDNTLINNLTRALEIAEMIAAVLQAINIIGSIFNPVGAVGAIPLAEGGSVVNKGSSVRYTPWKSIPKFANGVKDFMVPGGFPNDSYPILVQSGERVTVTPANAVGSSLNNSEVVAAIKALSMNVSKLELKVNVTNNAPDVQTTVRKHKRVENRIVRQGDNVNEY